MKTGKICEDENKNIKDWSNFCLIIEKLLVFYNFTSSLSIFQDDDDVVNDQDDDCNNKNWV